MTYSVVAGTPSAASGGTTATCSIASTPTTGQYVVLAVQTNGSSTVSASGIGATWSTLCDPISGSAGQVAYLIGEGATSSGTITVTLGTFRSYQVHPFVVSGFAGKPVAVRLISTGTAAAMTGPSQVCSSGVVLATAYMSGSATMTWPTSELPSGGWTASTITTSSTNRYAAAYAVPSGSATFQTAASFSASATSLLSQIWLKEPATYTGQVLADSPVLYWHLDEQSGTQAADASGNARHGAYSGTPTLNATSLLAVDGGGAVSLGGGTQRVSIAANTIFNIASATAGFTIEAWVKPTDTTSATLQVIADKSNNSTANGQWTVYYDNRNTGAGTVQNLRFTYAGGGSDYIDWAGSATASALAAGGHLVCVVDSTTAYVYWNGALVASGSRSATAPSASTQALSLGATSANINNLVGTVDEFAIYQSALSATRVLAHYDAGAGSGSGSTGSASLSGSGTLTASGSASMGAAASFSGDGTLATSGSPAIATSAGFGGSGTLTVSTASSFSGAAALSGSGTLSLSTLVALFGPVGLSGSGTLTLSAVPGPTGSADFSGSGTLIAGVGTYGTSMSLSGAGTLTAIGVAFIPELSTAGVVIGASEFAFSLGSFVHPYAASSSTGSQAVTFANPATSPDLIEPAPLDRSQWVAFDSTASELLHVTASLSFAYGLEVWTGDGPYLDDLSLLDSGTTSVDVAISAAQRILIRAFPTAGGTGAGTLSWSAAARPDSGLLQFFADATIGETPGWLVSSVACATPDGTLEFTLDGSATVVFTATADELGLWADSGVLLPLLTAGSHSITVIDVTSGQMATRTFSVDLVPDTPAGPGTVPPPTAPTVMRWTFEDPGVETYVLPINPSKMSTPLTARAITAEHALSPSGQSILWEGLSDPTMWTVQGVTQTQAFYEALERFHELDRRFYVSDHLGRTWVVSFDGLEFVEMKSAVNNWEYGYTAKFLILDGPVTI